MFDLCETKQEFNDLSSLINKLNTHKDHLKCDIRNDYKSYNDSIGLIKDDNDDNPKDKIKKRLECLRKTLYIIELVEFLAKSYKNQTNSETKYYIKSSSVFFHTINKEDSKTKPLLDKIINALIKNQPNDMDTGISSLSTDFYNKENKEIAELKSYYHINYYLFKSINILSVILMVSSILIVSSSLDAGFAVLIIGGVLNYAFSKQDNYYADRKSDLISATDTEKNRINQKELIDFVKTENKPEKEAQDFFQPLWPK